MLGTLASFFMLGLAHTLHPCEDKPVVSAYALWRAGNWREGLLLILLYGLGMTAVDSCLAAASAYLGLLFLREVEWVLHMIAGVILVAVGIVMLVGARYAHLTHHHGRAFRSRLDAVAFGTVMGLPPCPIEFSVLLWAAAVGNIWLGALGMLIFGMGTTLGLLPLGALMGGLASSVGRSNYARLMPKFSGVVIIAFGLLLLLGLEVL